MGNGRLDIEREVVPFGARRPDRSKGGWSITRMVLDRDERDELADIVEQAASRATPSSLEETRAKTERGFLQSERGEVVDGETFSAGLLAELDDPEHKRPAG